MTCARAGRGDVRGSGMGAAKGDGCVAAEDGGSGLGGAVAAENGERGRVQAPLRMTGAGGWAMKIATGGLA